MIAARQRQRSGDHALVSCCEGQAENNVSVVNVAWDLTPFIPECSVGTGLIDRVIERGSWQAGNAVSR